MTLEECRRARFDLGAFVAGQLDSEEGLAIVAHLDRCPSCRTEADELAAVSRLLPLAQPAHLDQPPSPPPGLVTQVVERLRDERRTRRRTAWRARVAVVAAAVVGVVVGAIGATTVGDEEPERGRPIAFTVVEDAITAEARLTERPWGAGISLAARGLEPGEVYAVWLQQPDGSRVSAGTFRAGPDRAIRCYMTAGVPPDEATALGVSDSDGRTVLLAPAVT